MDSLTGRTVLDIVAESGMSIIESLAVPPGTLMLSSVPLNVLSGILEPQDSATYRDAYEAVKAGRVVIVTQAKE